MNKKQFVKLVKDTKNARKKILKEDRYWREILNDYLANINFYGITINNGFVQVDYKKNNLWYIYLKYIKASDLKLKVYRLHLDFGGEQSKGNKKGYHWTLDKNNIFNPSFLSSIDLDWKNNMRFVKQKELLTGVVYLKDINWINTESANLRYPKEYEVNIDPDKVKIITKEIL